MQRRLIRSAFLFPVALPYRFLLLQVPNHTGMSGKDGVISPDINARKWGDFAYPPHLDLW